MRTPGPNTALGIFLGVFGALVLLSAAFTDTTRGRLVNGICGGLLIASAVALAAAGNGRGQAQ